MLMGAFCCPGGARGPGTHLAAADVRKVNGMEVDPFAPGDADVFVAGLLAAIDVDGGPTDEQLAVLRAFVTHVWKRPDLDLATVTPLSPGELAARLPAD